MPDDRRFPCTQEGCDQTAYWTGRGRHPKYCDQHRAYRSPPIAVRVLIEQVCVECETRFKSDRRDTCSEPCRERIKWRARAARIPKRDYYCQTCNDPRPLAWSGQGRHPITCEQCQQANRRDHAHNRRARTLGVGTSRRALLAPLLANTEGLHCCLCEERIDLTLAYPDPMSRSLEHLVPLSRGGSHAANNVALSHLVCNVRRGVKPIDEYRASLGLSPAKVLQTTRSVA
jgi:DNA-binding protein H-NS